MSDSGSPGGLGAREFIAFVALLSALSALAIDMLLPAFSEMRVAFGLEPDATDLSLTITLFFVGTGIGNLFYGPLADAVGRKPVLTISVLLFAAASVVAALAPNLWLLYAARFVWGFAAAGPRTLSQAIVRDRHAGDAMAQVMTLVLASFMLAPVVAPLLGAGILRIGSWRWVLAFGAISATVVLLWSLRLKESLRPQDRRPFRPTTVLQGYRAVLANPITRGYLVALTFTFGAFISFLSSTELLFEDVFERPGWFVPYFSIVSCAYALSALTANRALRRWRGTTVMAATGTGMVTASLGLLVLATTSGGRPNVVVFLVVFSTANIFHIAFFPTANSLALEPMGKLAGTAAAVLGVVTFVVGAFLGSLIDRFIDGTMTPVAVGYTVYSGSALLFQLWTTHHHVAPFRLGARPARG